MANSDGLHLVYEGRDACGKETQSKLIAERFREYGIDAHVFSFPQYETFIGQVLRSDLRDEAMFCKKTPEGFEPSEYRHHVFQCINLADKLSKGGNIRDLLAEGRVVICDRWKPSGECFAPHDGVPLEWVESIQSLMSHGDLNFLLDLPTEIAAQRRPKLRDRYEQDREKQEALRKTYADYWRRRHFEGRWDVIDGNRTRGEILDETWRLVCDVAYARATLLGIQNFGDDHGVSFSLRRSSRSTSIAVDWFDSEANMSRNGLVSIEKVVSWCRRVKPTLEDMCGDPDSGLRTTKLSLFDLSDLPLVATPSRFLTFIRRVQLMTLPRGML